MHNIPQGSNLAIYLYAVPDINIETKMTKFHLIILQDNNTMYTRPLKNDLSPSKYSKLTREIRMRCFSINITANNFECF